MGNFKVLVQHILIGLVPVPNLSFSGTRKPLVSRNIIRFEKVSCKITNSNTNINANSDIVKLADVVGDDVTCSLPHSMSNDGTFKLLSVSPLPLLALAALPGGNGLDNTTLFHVFFVVTNVMLF
jgi:hypothetical protein